jgi:hypothetical protein
MDAAAEGRGGGVMRRQRDATAVRTIGFCRFWTWGNRMSRRCKPVWSDGDLKYLFYTLGCAGYGWLRPEGVRRELAKMAAMRTGPPPLA